jgi:hypothetical protein
MRAFRFRTAPHRAAKARQTREAGAMVSVLDIAVQACVRGPQHALPISADAGFRGVMGKRGR